MPLWLRTLGRPHVAIGICDRCKMKFPLDDLFPDPNTPGLRVCRKDQDLYDPWRLPAPAPDIIALPFARPDEPVGLTPAMANETGYYGGLLGLFDITVMILVPGSSVRIAWPDAAGIGFPIVSYELWGYRDNLATSLIGTFDSSILSYDDNVGYTTGWGYYVVAVGNGGQRAFSPLHTYVVPAAGGPVPAPLVVGQFDTDISYYSTFMTAAVPYGAPVELFIEWSLDSNPFDPVDGIWYLQEDFAPFPAVLATTSLVIFSSLGVSTISYRIKARSGAIESDYSDVVHAFNLSATLVSFTEVDLAWATPDVLFTGFEIYAYHDIGHDPPVIGDFTLLASVDEFTFNYTDNTPFSTNYGYYVRAIGTGDDAFTPAALWKLLPAPINLQITYPVFSFLPLLSWDASTDPQVVGYRIEQIYYDSATGDALPPNFTDVGTNSYGGLLGFVYGLIRIRVCCLNAGGVEVSPFSDYIYYISGTGCVPYADGSGLSSPFLPAFPTTLGALSASLYFFGPEDATSDPADRGSFGSVGIVAPPTGAEYTYIPPHNHGVNPLGVNCEWWYFWRVTFDGQTFESNLFDQNEPIFHPPGGTPPGQ